jgi:hypothetical protein
MVDTAGYPDVQQWIELMALMGKILEEESNPSPEDLLVAEQQPEANANSKKRARDDSGDVVQPAEGTARELRPLKKIHYRLCVKFSCGKCMTCLPRT